MEAFDSYGSQHRVAKESNSGSGSSGSYLTHSSLPSTTAVKMGRKGTEHEGQMFLNWEVVFVFRFFCFFFVECFQRLSCLVKRENGKQKKLKIFRLVILYLG